MNTEETQKNGVILVKKLTDKFEKCSWAHSIGDCFTLKLGHSTIFLCKELLKVVTDSGVDLLVYRPVAENQEAYNLATLYSKAYKIYDDRIAKFYTDLIAELDALNS